MNTSDTSFGISESELFDMINHDDNIVIYDLRKMDDFAKGHIKKSKLVQFDEKHLIDVSKSTKVVLVSKDEEQSKTMMAALRSHNIDAFYLIGGIKNWSKGFYYTNISYVGTGYP